MDLQRATAARWAAEVAASSRYLRRRVGWLRQARGDGRTPLRERNRAIVMDETGANGLKLLALLFRRPLVNVNFVAPRVEVTFPTANRLMARFEELGFFSERPPASAGAHVPLRPLVRCSPNLRSRRAPEHPAPTPDTENDEARP